MRSVLVDAGPLIALADRSDKHHRRVAAFLRRFEGRLLTTWPVRWADAGGVSVFELHESAFAALADWKEKYLDLPMDPADATLLWVAQQTGVLEILTIDLKDFSVYRLPGGKALRPVL
ncbi:MAG: PIN domain-containing protein [Betaproteobacteria bacterium]|nr:PIN domain-containing protein [Betaproteobacteria bacterium]